MLRVPSSGVRRVRSIFVSDVHLGCRYADAEAFLQFLQTHEARHVYLVGDFIDGWRLKRVWHWRPLYNRILLRLYEMSLDGTRLYYTPGNHDAFLRDFIRDFGIVEIDDQFVHRAADGRRYLVTHGDRFDTVEIRSAWLSVVGSIAYDWLLMANNGINGWRSRWRLRPWAFSAAVKKRVKQVVTFVGNFERKLIEHAESEGCDGVICGHIHTPLIAQCGGVTYCNTGDWMENCTALLEHENGQLELVYGATGEGQSERVEGAIHGEDHVQYGGRGAGTRHAGVGHPGPAAART